MANGIIGVLDSNPSAKRSFYTNTDYHTEFTTSSFDGEAGDVRYGHVYVSGGSGKNVCISLYTSGGTRILSCQTPTITADGWQSCDSGSTSAISAATTYYLGARTSANMTGTGEGLGQANIGSYGSSYYDSGVGYGACGGNITAKESSLPGDTHFMIRWTNTPSYIGQEGTVGDPYKSIGALNLAECNRTIYLKANTYTTSGTTDLTKSCTSSTPLIIKCSNGTIENKGGCYLYNAGLRLAGSWTTLDGFDFRQDNVNSMLEIDGVGASYNTITDCKIRLEGNANGLTIGRQNDNCQYNTISNNLFDGTVGFAGYGVRVRRSRPSVIFGTDGQLYRCTTGHTASATTYPTTGTSWATYWTLGSPDSYSGKPFVVGTVYNAGASILNNKYNVITKNVFLKHEVNANYSVIQLGDGAFIDEPSYYTTVSYNLFKDCNTDSSLSEIIENKTSNNYFLYNTFDNVGGTLSFRTGSNSKAIGNIWKYLYNSGTYYVGIRISGSGHIIANNYLEGAPNSTCGETLTGSDNSGVNDKTTYMVDTTKNFVTLGVSAGDYIYNDSSSPVRSASKVTTITTTTCANDTLNFLALSGGTKNEFDNGDLYSLARHNSMAIQVTWGGTLCTGSGVPQVTNVLIANNTIKNTCRGYIMYQASAVDCTWAPSGVTYLNNIAETNVTYSAYELFGGTATESELATTGNTWLSNRGYVSGGISLVDSDICSGAGCSGVVDTASGFELTLQKSGLPINWYYPSSYAVGTYTSQVLQDMVGTIRANPPKVGCIEGNGSESVIAVGPSWTGGYTIQRPQVRDIVYGSGTNTITLTGSNKIVW